MLEPRRVAPEYREQIPQWLDTFKFDALVTLATNDPSLGWKQSGSSADYLRLRDLLREWDSRMHRKLVGRDWVHRVADRMWGFYFLEKPHSNPHWHALIQFCNAWPGLLEKQQKKLRIHAPLAWARLCPSGTVDIQDITEQRGVAEYVAKTLGYPVSYEHFVTPDEF